MEEGVTDSSRDMEGKREERVGTGEGRTDGSTDSSRDGKEKTGGE